VVIKAAKVANAGWIGVGFIGINTSDGSGEACRQPVESYFFCRSPWS